jgi:hypothetical protein
MPTPLPERMQARGHPAADEPFRAARACGTPNPSQPGPDEDGQSPAKGDGEAAGKSCTRSASLSVALVNARHFSAEACAVPDPVCGPDPPRHQRPDVLLR